MRGFFSSSTIQKEKPAGMVPKCGACGLYKKCESPKMEPFGSGRKRVLVVGDAPGIADDAKGRPFSGKAGSYLRDILDDLGVDLDRDAWQTNSLICHPLKNKAADTKQISHCRPNLLNAISEFKPQVIITLGHSPLKSVLTGKWDRIEALERWVGWRIPLEDHWVCPTFHPHFVSHQRNSLLEKLFVSHLQAAFAIDTAPLPQPNWEKMVEIIYDDDVVYESLVAFNALGGWIAFDYETNCLKPEYPQAKISSCSVSNGDRTIAFPWKGRAIEGMSRLLKSKRTKKIASNLKFEEKWTRAAFGHGVTNWGWDTMIAAHCLDNRPGICSIKFQALILLGVPVYNERIEPYLSGKGWYNRIHYIEPKELLLYNGLDSVLEYKVAMIQRKEMGYES